MSRTYYEILGVPGNASEREIKAAYHRLARQYHPDKVNEGTDPVRMEQEFTQISMAYNVIKDPEKRSAYDQTLELKRQQEGSTGGGAKSPDSTQSFVKPGRASAGSGTNKPSAGEVEKSRMAVARRAFLKGLQCMSAGDYAKAAEFFEVAVKNNDADAVCHSKLAQTLLRSHRSFSRATEAAKRAIELDPYNSEFRLILAEIYEAAGSTTMALQTYEEILRWDAGNTKAMTAVRSLKPSKSLLSRLFGKK